MILNKNQIFKSIHEDYKVISWKYISIVPK